MGKSTSTSVILKITNAILRIFLNILFYVAVVWITITAGKYVYDFSYQLFGSVPAAEEPGKDIDFRIESGESTMDIAKKLEFNGLIVNKYSFYLKTKFKSYDIYPGTYVLNTSMDYDDILKEITDQKNSIVKEVAKPKVTPTPKANEADGTQGAENIIP
ncbi:MAG: endolytic transglycosylase MltG [Clostridiales bacterium]|nr:endolytic transglycosylase MltG [Clostridiales bacterium]